MFKLVSNYKPTGDQPQAIEYLSNGIKEGKKFQTLLGVTGSRKNIYNGKHNRKSSKTYTSTCTQQDTSSGNYTQSLRNSSQKTMLNILYLIMIIISQKHILHLLIHTLKRILL